MSRFSHALAATLAVLALPAMAGDEEELLRDVERMTRLQSGGAASAEDLNALVAELLPRVGKVMRLPVPSRVEVKIVSRDEARAALLEVLRRDYPGDTLERLSEALAAVGLVAEGTDLRAEAQSLYGGNVSGFYDPHRRRLYLLSDQPLAAQTLIVAHELAHAVQDEAIRLDAASRKVRASEDAQLALSAAIEGQAQQVASLVLAGDVGGSDSAGVDLGSLLNEAAAAGAAMAAGQSSVPWLGLQLSFPYVAGARLVAAVRTDDDPTATVVLRRLPRSTAQVLDPALYRADERPQQARLDLAGKLRGSSALYATTLGAANLDLFGDLHGGGELGRGWRGDRLETVRLGGKLCAVWAVSFASAEGAERLAKAWSAAVGGGADEAAQPDGSRYVVRRSGTVAVLLENVPPERIGELVSAAAEAFR